ncbi:MAG: HAD-IC family P-type ATPase [Candidatus Moranbacteria bacterium]|nr:HAD-IC family P-type ATPase [Candidatus Moranbacteria bacterium]
MTWKKFSIKDIAQIFLEFQTAAGGLVPSVAHDRLQREGKNSIEEQPFSLSVLVKRRFRSSFLYILLLASLLSFFLGDRFEAGLILLFVGINVCLETYQEYRSFHASKLLKRYLVTFVRVRRENQIFSIESENVVPGDIILLEPGNRLAADVRFIHTNGLVIDESVLTGESVSVHKIADTALAEPKEMSEAKNIGFAGTVVTAGIGEGVVFATGRHTVIGDIAALTEEGEHKTEFEKDIIEFNRFIIKLVFLTITLIFLANIFIRDGSIETAKLFIFSLALAVSVIPEALPVIVTVALSRGSLRLAQKKVIVKRLSAIEDLGSIEVLCTDKTGTLTENVLSVSRVEADEPNLCLRLAFAAALVTPMKRQALHDAFDLALWHKLSSAEKEAVWRMERLDHIPFDPERRRNSVLLSVPRGKNEIIVRGAPEEIMKRSHNVDTFAIKHLTEKIEEAGRKGERVLAVARRIFPHHRYTMFEEQQLEFIGLIFFVDQLKKTAKHTLDQAASLGVEVKILTGDSKEVAGAIGSAVGLIQNCDDTVTGAELFALSYEERRQVVFAKKVFARVSPREKYEIIKMLKERKTVGFLGEGINDAPALGLANVALVVQHASDIAREAADVVLLQKSLETVIDGIKEGRTIFANIRKYLKITLASNFGNFYSVALASLFLPFVPLLPIQILLLNLLSDFPMIAIATDTVDEEELEQPKTTSVHSIILLATFFGMISSVFDFILFGYFSQISETALQTAWFFLSLGTEIILIFSLRTKLPFFFSQPASFFLRGFSLFAVFLGIGIFFTPLGEMMHFLRPTQELLIVVMVLIGGYFLVTEIAKRFYYRGIGKVV